jgi:IPT/TIG domain
VWEGGVACQLLRGPDRHWNTEITFTAGSTDSTGFVWSAVPGTGGDRAPAITAVSPNSGKKAGGTNVTITGIGLTGATKVTFGGVAATSFTVVSATEITAVSPAGAVGVRNVVVTTPSGASPVVAADDFTYTAS